MSRQVTEPGAVLVYGSMYGHTAMMAEYIASGLRHGGVKTVKIYDSSDGNIGKIIRDIWRYKGLALLSCCYNMGLYPAMYPVIEKIKNAKVNGRILAVAGNYTWSKGMEIKELAALAETPGWELVDNIVEVKSAATKEDEETLVKLGEEMAKKILASE